MPRTAVRRRRLGVAVLTALALGAAAAAPAAQAQDEEPTDLITNGDFAAGTNGWWTTANLTGAVADGEWCIDVPGGTANAWDAIVGQDGLPLVTGESYELRFTARASTDVSVRALVQRPVDPWPTAVEEFPLLTSEAQDFSYAFTASADWSDAQLAFQIGRNAEPWQFCLSEVQLLTGAEPPVYEPDTGPRVRVNQVGYLPDGPKQATLVTEATDPVPWQLRNAEGALVAEGDSTPHGPEATSGESVHVIDFSGGSATGEGFTLTADGETSYPFAIGGNPYRDMAVDAMSFFYPQRSGIAIDDTIAPGYGREAGHVDVAPNQGDSAVPCYAEACDYTLDVAGGWYDAGDHGKYVVNGGISVAQLMSVYERALHAPTGDASLLEDGSLRIPEHGDGVPDVLDEARWEVEFLLSMQVPAGEELAGMAHHKIHDENWTGLPLLPADDPQPRYLYPPSTAATLNLAAAAAQAARLFAPYDAEFAAECLEAAETAWAAALAHPDVYAPDTSPAGGGPYGDSNVSDEFYWAAAELFLTTGKKTYEEHVLDSKLHEDDVFGPGAFSWASVAAIAKLDLALVPNALPGRDDVVAQVVAGADNYLELQAASPWGLSYGSSGTFDWGSNSAVLNELVVVATAFDLTGEAQYRDGVLGGLDYLLGRNALGNSYVTGYGSHDSHNMHSRWYANQLDPSLPNPPAGTLAGGPNSVTATWDPIAQRWLNGCAPQRCYIDDIGSWATNELTINWNAPLAQIANFAAEQAGTVSTSPSCKVEYRINGQWPGGFNAQILVTNTGAEPLQDLTLTWALPTGQSIVHSWSVALVQDGHTVTATELGGGYDLKPGRTYSFGLIGSKDARTAVAPASVSCSAG
ncbi:glycoside hydrolase family 9 protein [Glycomyces algeriensis]|uniref:Endoglucanase n=1 Tax=Glycomyces algeriensis TaxID=256037 RepID=A0A9W6GCD5_9ACTN|nr:glycoside hydrolase family 9 protein [Glycomyces algeriensis]MDA1365812.1 glycoside hydrolase family 9 protein [Glycomyces algeriensis]MDR7351501.1 endoglucanase [Glycomyces algeriensis]GLI44222.1 endoglucanase [Glycomyces algeriensis]